MYSRRWLPCALVLLPSSYNPISTGYGSSRRSSKRGSRSRAVVPSTCEAACARGASPIQCLCLCVGVSASLCLSHFCLSLCLSLCLSSSYSHSLALALFLPDSASSSHPSLPRRPRTVRSRGFPPTRPTSRPQGSQNNSPSLLFPLFLASGSAPLIDRSPRDTQSPRCHLLLRPGSVLACPVLLLSLYSTPTLSLPPLLSSRFLSPSHPPTVAPLIRPPLVPERTSSLVF